MVRFGNDWDEILRSELDSDYFSHIIKQLHIEYKKYSCFPPPELVFNALRSTAYGDVRAVILGQDPYHGEGQAHGLCFSVRKGVDVPPSLQNIYKEIGADIRLTKADFYARCKKCSDKGYLPSGEHLTQMCI